MDIVVAMDAEFLLSTDGQEVYRLFKFLLLIEIVSCYYNDQGKIMATEAHGNFIVVDEDVEKKDWCKTGVKRIAMIDEIWTDDGLTRLVLKYIFKCNIPESAWLESYQRMRVTTCVPNAEQFSWEELCEYYSEPEEEEE